jgi:AhpD family alkylhydroperoxidase
MESQLDLNQERLRAREKWATLLPDTMAGVTRVQEAAYADGVLSAKHKRLIALGIALGRGCTNCVLGQTVRALEAGATAEEILETTGVAAAIGGTMGMAESFRVVALLEEMDKL